ncbi:hypothetical protein KC19_9G068300 [Ceratodon purpureus]|uniref:Uncharacterized protein n=1 Tax=Ceratodon purpureus TaxID=3225 RepID=A0A8T0GSZ4_CERPU|nr:hypothetical protein KC19_9G068300 [Ceratodon purpureus]
MFEVSMFRNLSKVQAPQFLQSAIERTNICSSLVDRAIRSLQASFYGIDQLLNNVFTEMDKKISTLFRQKRKNCRQHNNAVGGVQKHCRSIGKSSTHTLPSLLQIPARNCRQFTI